MVKDLDFTLYNGVKIPAIGFGTWQAASGEEAYNSALWAIKAGYRHIDTAYAYENEASIAKAIKDSNVGRENIFITTKLPSHIKTYEGCMDYFNQSLKNLDTDYIDLYLIHAPWPWSNVGEDCTEGNIEAWKAMVDLYNQKKIRSIGVSNFHEKDIRPLIEATGVKPMVNQIRFFIGNTQEPITKYCQENDILIEAYSPLATGAIVDNPILQDIAAKYNTSIPKICIRYCLERGTLPLPKSVREQRIIDNLDVNFKIDDEDMTFLNSIVDTKNTRKLRS